MSLQTMKDAKAKNHLDTLIRTSQYGICTRGQRLQQAIAEGSTLEAATVRDEARERKIQRELDAMRGRDGWGVPTGNECHPITIKFNALKKELADGPTTTEYRLHRPHGEYWNVITKTEYEYALGLEQMRRNILR